MKANVIALSTTLLILTLCSCQKDIQENNIRFNNVDPELWPYYAAFEAEAKTAANKRQRAKGFTRPNSQETLDTVGFIVR